MSRLRQFQTCFKVVQMLVKIVSKQLGTKLFANMAPREEGIGRGRIKSSCHGAKYKHSVSSILFWLFDFFFEM